ncbi:DUF5753 domain-containing protein [Streptomyces sp. ODS28]|uniref:DUF5753 domain-containing protein n=1 Tax=Streptomyces sp. ODS28 TaxID=3136688 RepID=UPI0031EB21BF
MSRPRSGPTAALRLVAQALRESREAAGMSIAAAAEALHVHTMTISRMERAQTVPKRATVALLMSLYDVGEWERDALQEQLDRALEPGWWHPYRHLIPSDMNGLMDLETEAELIRVYAPAVIPEPLRAPGYARCLLAMRHPHAGAEEIEQRIELLQERQRHRSGHLWVLLEEAALHRPVGGKEIMAEQRALLERYAAGPQHDGVTLQWISAKASPHPLMLCGPVEIYRHPHPRIPDHLVLRGLTEQTVTDSADTVLTHTAAMDTAAAHAETPTTPLPGSPE